MAASLNNVATQDKYAQETTLICRGAIRLTFQVSNAAIYFRTGVGSPPRYRTEEFLLPIPASFDRRVDAVQVRSAAPGVPARVTVMAPTAREVGGG